MATVSRGLEICALCKSIYVDVEMGQDGLVTCDKCIDQYQLLQLVERSAAPAECMIRFLSIISLIFASVQISGNEKK